MLLKGQWYDGKTSAQVPATARPGPGGEILIEREEDGRFLFRAEPAEVQASPRLGNTPRYLTFSEGGKFVTPDNDGVDALMRSWQRRSGMDRVSLLEGRLRYVLLCLALFVVIIGVAVKWGLPFGAKVVSNLLPPSVFSLAQEQTLKFMDKAVFNPSKLDKKIQTRLRRHFQPVLLDHSAYALKVLFRQGGNLGPNAFALPAGTIIFTDEMVKMAQNDDELLAVLVHEIGHVAHRHAMRTLIQDSLLVFVIMAITGDVSGTSEVFIGLPVFLTELYYSREFELEADKYALEYMRNKNIELAHFANLMRRLEQKFKGAKAGEESKLSSYLSTHPRMKERLRPFEGKP